MRIKLLLTVLVLPILGCGSSQSANTSSVGGSAIGLRPDMEVSFHIFQGPTETLPATMRVHLGHLIDKTRHGLHPALVQRVPTANGVVWVFIDGGQICLAESNQGAVACSRRSDAIADGVTLGVFTPPTQRIAKPHDFLLFGLAPDDRHRALFVVGKHQRIAAITNNLFSAAADEPILLKQLLRGRQ